MFSKSSLGFPAAVQPPQTCKSCQGTIQQCDSRGNPSFQWLLPPQTLPWQASVTLRNSSLCHLLTASTQLSKTDLFLQHSPTEFTSQKAGKSNGMVQFQSSLIPSGSYWKKFLSPVTPLQSMLKGSALLYVDSGRKHCSLWYLERFYFTSARPEAFFGWNQGLNSEEKRAHQRTGKEFNN